MTVAIQMFRVGWGYMSMVGQSRSLEIFMCMPKRDSLIQDPRSEKFRSEKGCVQNEDLRSKTPIVNMRTDVCRMRMYIKVDTIELRVEMQCRGGC